MSPAIVSIPIVGDVLNVQYLHVLCNNPVFVSELNSNFLWNGVYKSPIRLLD